KISKNNRLRLVAGAMLVVLLFVLCTPFMQVPPNEKMSWTQIAEASECEPEKKVSKVEEPQQEAAATTSWCKYSCDLCWYNRGLLSKLSEDLDKLSEDLGKLKEESSVEDAIMTIMTTMGDTSTMVVNLKENARVETGRIVIRVAEGMGLLCADTQNAIRSVIDFVFATALGQAFVQSVESLVQKAQKYVQENAQKYVQKLVQDPYVAKHVDRIREATATLAQKLHLNKISEAAAAVTQKVSKAIDKAMPALRGLGVVAGILSGAQYLQEARNILTSGGCVFKAGLHATVGVALIAVSVAVVAALIPKITVGAAAVIKVGTAVLMAAYIAKLLYDPIVRVFRWLGNRVSGAVSRLRDKIIRDAASLLKNLAEKVIGGAVSRLRDKVDKIIRRGAASRPGNRASGAANTVRNTVSSAASWVKNRARDAASWVKNTVSSAANTVRNTVSSAASWVRNRARSAGRRAGRAVRSAFSRARNAGRRAGRAVRSAFSRARSAGRRAGRAVRSAFSRARSAGRRAGRAVRSAFSRARSAW
ncbi:hypothetical protein M1N67_02335, partial [Peptococcaceae bacterium]|nr:hypothetical protein [Peptococcaceae bacterium]